MSIATLSVINRRLLPYKVGLCKGKGYFYFFDHEDSPHFRADSIPSVYTCHLRDLTVDEWVAHAVDAIAKAELA